MQPTVEFKTETQYVRDPGDIVYVRLDPALQEACLSVPAHQVGGLRITADDGRVFQGPACQWGYVALRAQEAGVTQGTVQAISWPYH